MKGTLVTQRLPHEFVINRELLFSNITCALYLVSPKLSNICQLYVYVPWIYISKEHRLVQGVKVHTHLESAYSKIWRGLICCRARFGLNVSVQDALDNVSDLHFSTDSVWPTWCPCWFWFHHDHKTHWLHVHEVDSHWHLSLEIHIVKLSLHNINNCADKLNYAPLLIYFTYIYIHEFHLIKKSFE